METLQTVKATTSRKRKAYDKAFQQLDTQIDELKKHFNEDLSTMNKKIADLGHIPDPSCLLDLANGDVIVFPESSDGKGDEYFLRSVPEAKHILSLLTITRCQVDICADFDLRDRKLHCKRVCEDQYVEWEVAKQLWGETNADENSNRVFLKGFDKWMADFVEKSPADISDWEPYDDYGGSGGSYVLKPFVVVYRLKNNKKC